MSGNYSDYLRVCMGLCLHQDFWFSVFLLLHEFMLQERAKQRTRQTRCMCTVKKNGCTMYTVYAVRKRIELGKE